MNKGLVEWIVKTALLDEAVSNQELILTMKQNGISSNDLFDYIAEDAYWPINIPDTSFKLSPQDEKYIIDFKNPSRKRAVASIREQAREAVHNRFYTGHRFNEWAI